MVAEKKQEAVCDEGSEVPGSSAKHSSVPTRGSRASAETAGGNAGAGAGGGSVKSSLLMSC